MVKFEKKYQTFARLDYCQYLLISQINYTLTYFSKQIEKFSYDAINRYLAGEKIIPHLAWENMNDQVKQTTEGNLVFDDTDMDKNFSFKIDLVRRQWSGEANGIIIGVGVVTCIYVNLTLDQF